MISRRDFLVQTGGLAALGAAAKAGHPQSALAQILRRGQEPGTFNLEVTITGLAMFVQAPTRMDVLLPTSYEELLPHHPLVFYKNGKGYVDLHPDTQGLTLDLTACKPNSAQPPVENPKTWAEILSMEDILELYDIRHEPLRDRDKQKIPNLAGCVMLSPGERKILYREDVRGPWSAKKPEEDVERKFDMHLAWYVTWRTMGIPGDTLPWKLTNFDGSPSMTTLPTLTPDNQYWIRLVLSHGLSTQYPGTVPLAGDPPPADHPFMPHFRSFYSLYGLDPNDKGLPDVKYRGTPGSGWRQPTNTAYNCLPSGGH